MHASAPSRMIETQGAQFCCVADAGKGEPRDIMHARTIAPGAAPMLSLRQESQQREPSRVRARSRQQTRVSLREGMRHPSSERGGRCSEERNSFSAGGVGWEGGWWVVVVGERASGRCERGAGWNGCCGRRDISTDARRGVRASVRCLRCVSQRRTDVAEVWRMTRHPEVPCPCP